MPAPNQDRDKPAIPSFSPADLVAMMALIQCVLVWASYHGERSWGLLQAWSAAVPPPPTTASPPPAWLPSQAQGGAWERPWQGETSRQRGGGSPSSPPRGGHRRDGGPRSRHANA